MVDWNKNLSSIGEVDGEKLISKNYEKPIFLHRELLFYDLFQRVPLIKTPEIHSFDGSNLQTHFIESEEKDNLQTAREWARVHSYFMENPIAENRLLIQHDIEEVVSYVFDNISIFGKLGPIIKNRLSDVKINKEISTVLHGDLQRKNMVTFQGNNYYFDFELGGVGHPCRDIASMIISNPNKKKKLISTYCENAEFSYYGIEEDVDNWLMARSAQLYIIFDKRDGTSEQKRFIKNKLSKIIEDL
jgi:thiamine kinase-like enzyme